MQATLYGKTCVSIIHFHHLCLVLTDKQVDQKQKFLEGKVQAIASSMPFFDLVK
jgi:hypothetical protein